MIGVVCQVDSIGCNDERGLKGNKIISEWKKRKNCDIISSIRILEYDKIAEESDLVEKV